MTKKLALFLMVISLIFVAACGSNNGNDASNQSGNDASNTNTNVEGEKKDPVTINFMQYTASGSQEDTLEAMIAKFEETHPDIKVNHEVVDYGNYYTKLNVGIAGGDAPDVFEVGYENFVSYAAKDVLADLSPVIAADSEFDPSIYKQLAYDAFNYNGKQYGVVQNFSNVVLFYNKDLFDQYGVEYPTADWTWEDELEAAQKLTHPEDGIWGTYAPIQFWEFYKTIAQNGGGIWNDNNEPVVNSKENVEALQWMIDKASKYEVSPPLNSDTFNQADADLNAFRDGKLAMLRGGIWNFGRFADADLNWDIALEPGSSQKAHHFFADGLVVSKQTDHAEAAWAFIKFMSSDPYVVDQRIEKGWSVPAVADEKVLEAFYAQTPPASKKVVTDALDSLVLPPVGPLAEQWGELTGAVGEELDKARLGAADVQEALDNAQKRVEELLSE
ncbi:ABC transporter substrate-binding protein [Marinicrinis sediminis]|uniref:ABC transporter substrate-binding protein n=1 Tax=Marinicrinis sediminis TaxID=1652465 RepID=A0ABW5R8W3_9BACL